MKRKFKRRDKLEIQIQLLRSHIVTGNLRFRTCLEKRCDFFRYIVFHILIDYPSVTTNWGISLILVYGSKFQQALKSLFWKVSGAASSFASKKENEKV
ncbi:hypothetical protein OUZ56_029990 [Daphnia magna]|uniref:Uncharacterized protein n=1 Tax=Daphnia magna TaxID=35525 RepID=A0ABR0B8V8_9CRUS|nr:hypothetical protein OUZ56_029990 [Daphnia magna]